MLQTETFSYLNDNEYKFQTKSGHQGRIRRVNRNIARIFFVNASGETETTIPNGVMCQDGQALNILPFHDSFLITWVDRFAILENGIHIMIIENLKLQSIRTFV